MSGFSHRTGMTTAFIGRADIRVRFQRNKFQTETLPIALAFCMALAYDSGDRE